MSFIKPRAPLILQSEVSECALACIAMVASYHGKKCDLTTLRIQHGISNEGVTLRHLINLSNQIELESRAVKLELDQLTQLQTPCILHWNLNHFVVLIHAKKDKIIIHDPAIGRRQLSIQSASKHFTGVALELFPSLSFRKSRQQIRLKLTQFIGQISGVKRHLALLMILSIMLQVFALASPYYMQLVIDDVVTSGNQDFLLALALGFSLLLLIEIVVFLLRHLITLSFTSKLNLEVSSGIFNHLIRLPYDFFSKRHVGDIVSRFNSIGPIRDMISQGLISALLDGILAATTLIVMFYYDAKITLIAILVLAIHIGFKVICYFPLQRLNAEKVASAASENSYFMESLRAIRSIKLLSNETQRQSEWQQRLVETLNKDISLSKWNIFCEVFNRFLFGLESIVIIFVAAVAVMDNAMTLGMLYAFMSYKNRFSTATNNIVETLFNYRLLDVHLDRLSDIVHTEKEHLPDPISIEIYAPRGKNILEIKHLFFSYSKRSKPILSDISFNALPGESIAIIGASGAGKSTLLNCLMGLINPSSGEVLWQGQDINLHPTYKKQIAGVMQDDECLSGSLLNNVSSFDQNPNVKDIVSAAKMACIHKDIISMPMQYHTLVGDMGSSLSGGQKQRLIIARALYRKPQILFMDEATSHLDTDTEKALNTNLRSMGCIRIIVAHRPQTIATADRVLRLTQGRLVPVETSC